MGEVTGTVANPNFKPELSTVFSLGDPVSSTPGYTYGIQFTLTGLNPSVFDDKVTIETNFTDTVPL